MSDHNDGIHLRAVITSDKAVEGTYDFEVKSNGDPVILRGNLITETGGETELGEVVLGVHSSGSFTAQLKVQWQGGSSSCSRSTSKQP